MTNHKQVFTTKVGTTAVSCNCVGPQHSQPLCPCRMLDNVAVKDGRWIETIDHGPAKTTGAK